MNAWQKKQQLVKLPSFEQKVYKLEAATAEDRKNTHSV